MFDFYPQLKQRFGALRTRAEFFRCVMYASPGNACRYAERCRSPCIQSRPGRDADRAGQRR